jgi:hypothetical protein
MVFGLLAGSLVMPIAARAQDEEEGTFYYKTWTEQPYPAQYTNETIWIQVCGDFICDVPWPNVEVHTVWNYRTTTSYLDWHTGSDGKAAMIRNISGATCGYTVRVDIYVSNIVYEAAPTQINSVYFTPCGNNG